MVNNKPLFCFSIYLYSYIKIFFSISKYTSLFVASLLQGIMFLAIFDLHKLWFHTSFNFLGWMVFQILKDFSLCKNLSPNFCCPTILNGVLIWTDMNLIYMRMLPTKFKLFWPKGIWVKKNLQTIKSSLIQ